MTPRQVDDIVVALLFNNVFEILRGLLLLVLTYQSCVGSIHLQSTTEEDSTASSQSRQEPVTGTHPRAGFTILRPASGPSLNTSTGRTSPTQTGSPVDGQVSGIIRSLEGLEVEDEGNDAEDTALDGFLVNALKNRNDRIFLLKLDREFCTFINNPRYGAVQSLVFVSSRLFVISPLLTASVFCPCEFVSIAARTIWSSRRSTRIIEW